MSPDIAASVKARLLNRARATGEEFELTLARYGAERFLFRMGTSEAGKRCVLKGASLLSLWLDEPYRATRDVDLLATGASDDEAIRMLVAEICGIPCPEDGISYDLASLVIEVIRPEEAYAGKRVRFDALLGKSRIRMQIDIGTGDALTSPVQEVEYPRILETLPAPRVRAYPREAAVAEKCEAMVKLDTRNSRMKDFHDIWALAGAFAFDGPSLQRSVAACFERRGTPWTAEVPRALTPVFYNFPDLQERWQRYRTASTVMTPPPDFAQVGERIVAFLGPVREAIIVGSAVSGTWPAGGPWQ